MKPTQPMERSSGASVRQAGDVVIVGHPIALPRAAAIALRMSSGLDGHLAGLQADEHRCRPRRSRSAD